MAANAQQTLLQVTVASQSVGIHDAVDAAIDHDGHPVGHGGCYADILLDDQHRHIALTPELHQHGLDLVDNHRGQALGGLIHHQQPRIAQQRA